MRHSAKKSAKLVSRDTEEFPPSPPMAAREQVQAIAGQELVRFKAINGSSVHEFVGHLDDVHERLAQLGETGHNVYMFAQDVPLAGAASATDTDVEKIRVLFADGDNTKMPAEWHLSPTFILTHPDTGRWWAFWNVEDCPLDRFKETQQRIAATYKTDASVCNTSRVVRLAGYPRWKKGKRFAPYNFEQLSGARSMFQHHDHELGAQLPAAKERKRRDRSEPDDPVLDVTVDDPSNIEHFRNWCAGKSVHTFATPHGEVAAPCIEGQGGNNMLAATGAMAHDYGLSEDVAFGIALEHHNPRCEPPWDDDDYERHFRSGYRSASGRLGCRAPKHDYSVYFKPYVVAKDGEKVADPPHPQCEQRLLPILSGADMRHVRPVRWWIDDMVRDGPGLFWGPPKVGKTSLLASTAVAVMHGRNAWGAKTYNPDNMRALYLATEDMDGAQRAIYAACLKLGVPIEECRIDVVDLTQVHVPQLSNADHMKIVRDTMLAHNQKLLIVDVLAFAMAGQRLTESEVITEAFRHVAPLFNEHGISTWLSGHSVKNGLQFFGSVTLLGSVYFDWHVDKSGDHIIAKNENMRGAPSFAGVPRFAMELIELPESTDHRGKPATVMFPAFVDYSKKVLFEDRTKSADGDLFAMQQKTAIEILEDPVTTFPINNRDLARAVINRLSDSLRQDDPLQFEKQTEALGKRLTRVTRDTELWRYRNEDDLNGNGYALSFICPGRPRRTPKPKRA